MKNAKELLLETLREAIQTIQHKITGAITATKEIADKDVEEIKSMKPEDQVIFLELQKNAGRRLEELATLHGSPYFMKCELKYEKSDETKTIFFAKHQFSEQSIYSWVAPAAAIRFETPGPVSYRLPNGKIEKAELLAKEQYMIVDGKVIFFATEKKGEPRELIYQEHFSSRKSGFVLPEIVAIMEKAQDKVVRAHHKGPFVISGPAGSGKTTLALHRVAYLVQAPDTAASYPAKSIIVFVQDTGTKEYFSHLLPELGIKNVRIATFSEWAFEILGIEEATFVTRIGDTEHEKDIYEYEKLIMLRTGSVTHFSPRTKELYAWQKEQDVFDRIDLTLLLQQKLQKNKKIIINHDYYTPGPDGELVSRTRKTPLEYSLIVVDEFQNYMPEQLAIFNRVLGEDHKSIIYVGDIAQQIRLGTIRDWNHLGTIGDERKVMLEKVYRNTRQILEYIRSLGYTVSIPEGIKEGPAVVEKTFESKYEEIAYITSLMQATEQQAKTIGVLSKDEKYIDEFKKIFIDTKNIHVLSIAEAQGVEFDTVVIVGVSDSMFSPDSSLPQTFLEEKARINRDLLYVGLTRAISELHVIGEEKLTSLLPAVM